MRTPITISIAIIFLIPLYYFVAGPSPVKADTPVAKRAATSPPSVDKPDFVPGVVLVGLEASNSTLKNGRGDEAELTALSETFQSLGLRSIEPVFGDLEGSSQLSAQHTSSELDLGHIYRLRFSPDLDVFQTIARLKEDPNVRYAEPDYLARIIRVPTDPLYSGQWGLSQIDAPTAWDVVTGTTNVVIAVVDSGIDSSHPDLAGQLWINPGETAGNGIDDDSNGYVDDINGWNFVEDNANLSDNTGHGTEVSGVIAAATNNNIGITGVCWRCRLMVVKVAQPGGIANYSDIAAGITYK